MKIISDPNAALAELFLSESRRLKAETGQDAVICITAGGIPVRLMKEIGTFNGIRILAPVLESRL